MASITLSPVLRSLSGRMDGLVFYQRYGRQYARRYTVPANPDTEGQRLVRRAFGDAVRSWQSLSSEDKNKWRGKAARLGMSGYNVFLSRFMRANLPSGVQSSAYISRNSRPSPSSLPAFPSVYGSLPPQDRFDMPGLRREAGPPAG